MNILMETDLELYSVSCWDRSATYWSANLTECRVKWEYAKADKEIVINFHFVSNVRKQLEFIICLARWVREIPNRLASRIESWKFLHELRFCIYFDFQWGAELVWAFISQNKRIIVHKEWLSPETLLAKHVFSIS